MKSPYKNSVPGSLRDLGQVANRLGLETVNNKKIDQKALNIAGIDFMELVPSFVKDFLLNIMGRKASVDVNL